MHPGAKDLHESAKITFVGHATTLTEMSGVRILSDPLFRQRFRHAILKYSLITMILDDGC